MTVGPTPDGHPLAAFVTGAASGIGRATAWRLARDGYAVGLLETQVVERLGVHTILEKVLLIHGEWAAGRTTVVLVREPVGI